MKRVAKPAGRLNIAIEDAPIPEPGPNEVRIRAVRTLISRGSEIGRRYTREEAINPDIMGYSLAGVIDATGSEVLHLKVGDRVAASAPHAQYVVRSADLHGPSDAPRVFRLHPGVSFDQATYWLLVAGAVTWIDIASIGRDDTVAILGQGLVGNLLLQVAKVNGLGRIVAVDGLESRCELAERLGADAVINASKEDPVAAVHRLTHGVGADIVIYAVGGPAGPKAFEQAQDMVAHGGLLHAIGLYEDAPLPLYSGKIQGRRLLGGYFGRSIDVPAAERAMTLLAQGAIRTDEMTTHHFPYTRAADAFDLLYSRLHEALGVILDWNVDEAS